MLYIKKEIADLIKVNQNDLISSILDEINEVSNLKHLNDIEKLNEISSLIDEFNEAKKCLITEFDVEKYVDEQLIEDANEKAILYVEKESISECMKKYHVDSFLISYISEHIKMCKKIEHLRNIKNMK